MPIRYVAVVIALIALPLSAQSNDVGLWVSTAQLKDSSGLSFDNADGFGVSLNHFWTVSLSTEIGATWLRADTAIDIAGARALDAGRLKILPITANVQWHFARGSLFSPYIGAGVAYVSSDDLSSNDLNLAGVGRVKIDDKASWDANAGMNFGIGRSFAIAADAKYINYEPDATAAGTTEKLKLNPLVVSVGVRLRW